MPGIVWRQPRLLRPQIGGRVLCAAGITTASAARGEEVPAGCRARRYAECAQVSSAFHASDAQQGGGGVVGVSVWHLGREGYTARNSYHNQVLDEH